MIYVQLINPGGVIVVDVEVGDNPEAILTLRDPTDDGVPEAGQNGSLTGIADEAIAIVPNAIDTNNDIADFNKQAVTIGVAN